MAIIEVVGKIEGVISIGLSNEYLTVNVDQVFFGLFGEGLLQEIGEVVVTLVLVSGVLVAGCVLCAGLVLFDQF